MKILYEDNHLVVVDKPAGLLTQPNGTGEASLEEMLQERYSFLRPIHRIDKPTSGIVVCACSSKALARLHASVREKAFHKIYRAWVEGHLAKESGTLRHQLVHGNHCARVVAEGGKEAILHYRVVQELTETTLVEIELKTGRYHQIRTQFAAERHPIVGDKKYGSLLPYKEGIALQHFRCTIPHPVTREELVFQTRSHASGGIQCAS